MHAKSTSRKKWHVLVLLDRYSEFKDHCIEPIIIYTGNNCTLIRIEPKQSNLEFYDQREGAAMGSPVSAVVANLYIEFFLKLALRTAPSRPHIWKRYVDDTFTLVKVMWMSSWFTSTAFARA